MRTPMRQVCEERRPAGVRGRRIASAALVMGMSIIGLLGSNAQAASPVLARCAPDERMEQVLPGDTAAIQQIFKDAPPIFLAMGDDRREQLRTVLASGASPNVCHAGMSPLMLAIQQGDMQTIEALLQAGANPNHPRSPIGESPLNLALSAGRWDAANLLLARGADARATSDGGSTSVHALLLSPAAPGPEKDRLLQALLKRGVSADAGAGRSRTTPLMLAAVRGDTAAAQVLVAAGANVNARNARDESALSLARRRSQQEMVEWLRRAGASP